MVCNAAPVVHAVALARLFSASDRPHLAPMPPTRELATLTALAQALSRPAGLAESLDGALATVAEALGLETGWVWLLEEGTDEPRLAAARALPRVLEAHPEAMHGDCYCLKTFRSGDLHGAANVNVVWCSRLAQVPRRRSPSTPPSAATPACRSPPAPAASAC
jgi:hypothetical protein